MALASHDRVVFLYEVSRSTRHNVPTRKPVQGNGGRSLEDSQLLGSARESVYESNEKHVASFINFVKTCALAVTQRKILLQLMTNFQKNKMSFTSLVCRLVQLFKYQSIDERS